MSESTANGHRSSVIGHRLSVIGHRKKTVNHAFASSGVASRQPSAVNRQPRLRKLRRGKPSTVNHAFASFGVASRQPSTTPSQASAWQAVNHQPRNSCPLRFVLELYKCFRSLYTTFQSAEFLQRFEIILIGAIRIL